MKIQIILEDADFPPIHDVIVEARGVSYSYAAIQRLFDELPEGLQIMAADFGTSDTVFRDELFSYIKELDGGESQS